MFVIAACRADYMTGCGWSDSCNEHGCRSPRLNENIAVGLCGSLSLNVALVLGGSITDQNVVCMLHLVFV